MSRHMLMPDIAGTAFLLAARPAQSQNGPDEPAGAIVPRARQGVPDRTARQWPGQLTRASGRQFAIPNRDRTTRLIGIETPPDRDAPASMTGDTASNVAVHPGIDRTTEMQGGARKRPRNPLHESASLGAATRDRETLAPSAGSSSLYLPCRSGTDAQFEPLPGSIRMTGRVRTTAGLRPD